jgi:hypothetical protein
MSKPEPHGAPAEQPSFRAATRLAREAAFAAMRKAGRFGLNEADRAIGNALLARLFWHVEGAEGGFVGLSDEALQERVAHYRLDLTAVRDAAWAPGAWPVSAIAQKERIAA